MLYKWSLIYFYVYISWQDSHQSNPCESKDLYTWFLILTKWMLILLTVQCIGQGCGESLLLTCFCCPHHFLVSQYSGAMLQLCPDVFVSGHLSATIIQPGCNWTPLLPWPTSTDPQPLSASAVEEKREQLGEPPADPLPTQKEIKMRLTVPPHPQMPVPVSTPRATGLLIPLWMGLTGRARLAHPPACNTLQTCFQKTLRGPAEWTEALLLFWDKKRRHRGAEHRNVLHQYGLSYYLAVLTRSRLSY